MGNTQIFVNLPVRDLDRSVAYFTALGYRFDPRFTDDTATCMIVSDTIHVMLLTHAKFATFTPNPVADARQVSEVLLALSLDSRQAVDDIVGRAVDAGATECRPPADHGFMYERSVQDLDGHIWEYFHMDMEAVATASG